MSWQPSLGAWPVSGGTRFRVWAPEIRQLSVVLSKPAAATDVYPLSKAADGTFSSVLAGTRPGDRYRYQIDGTGSFPDPASRCQPEGVHGPSEIINPGTFVWTDQDWKGIGLRDLIFYELHVGTFTPQGTFAAVVERLPYLADLGVTAIELMPVADFPGRWNWGYDGVDLFAPARCYGRPDDLRRLVNEAHRIGLAVFLDVVYNHLGPDGNYLGLYSPYYFSEKHHTAWGQALNFDGEHNARVREFFIENALHWIHEYHMDGLRLDATHAIRDDSPRKFLAELSDRVHASVFGRQVHVIAEDHRNLAIMLKPTTVSGWGLDGVWADDFHHQMRRLLAGDRDGYFSDYNDSVNDLATTIRNGWLYSGQFSSHLNEPRGTDSAGISREHMVYCLQNHDQVGNRAFGERLNQQIDPAAFRAASALLLCCPATPLLFMGQEWAADAPFLFFTDHNPELGKLVTEGRRKEFRHFAAFADPHIRERIPDPQAPATFEASRLKWDERQREPHSCVLRLYQELLRLRRREPALRGAAVEDYTVSAVAETGIVLCRRIASGPEIVVVVQLRGAGDIDLGSHAKSDKWETILDTEDPRFSPDPRPISVRQADAAPTIRFKRPGAVILRESRPSVVPVADNLHESPCG
jgi:maltooligosyltrehalose trehalohydrolase